MKLTKDLFVVAAAAFCLTPSSQAQLFNQSFTGINATIPDGNLSGLANAQSVSGTTGLITDIDVSLTITGTGFGAVNGDFYVYLEHGGQLSVLLNRPGRRADSSLGYDDNGLNNVTFNNTGPDVHTYRISLSGDNTVALSNPLTGTWSPDARNVSPLTSLNTSPRTAGLDVFNGISADGDWTLFVADVESGGTARLDSWGLNLTTTPVPEPSQTAMIAGLVLSAFAVWRRRQRS